VSDTLSEMPPLILAVCGTRPEAIKLAPLVRRLRESHGQLEIKVCTTGQHREMLDPVFEFFGVIPDVDLNLMTPGQTLAHFASTALAEVSRVVRDLRPAYVVVQGDTTTAFVAGLAAFYERIPVGHVEAGLRTGDPYAPFPEEVNRRLLSVVAAQHFAPTDRDRGRLLDEGVPADRVHVTGNTVVDALLDGLRIIDRSPAYAAAVDEHLRAGLAGHAPEGRLVLITAHRRESFGEAFRSICGAIRALAERFPGDSFVYPAHLNPEVQRPVREMLTGLPNLVVLPPVDYPSMLVLMRRAYLILTDSGGIQEEAPTLGVPTVVMRNKTEREDGVAAGVSMLAGTDRAGIIEGVSRLMTDAGRHQRMRAPANPYGDGRASERIARAIAAHLSPDAERQPTCS
jgi:UDP-N-acetylglucosamine 2-epimerase (non-hydrolysing)